jgi:cell division protein FtsL
MKRKHLIYGLVVVVVAIVLFIVYYLYLGSSAPSGQQPLVRLDNTKIDSLKKSFNDSADSVRVMVMLSPT